MKIICKLTIVTFTLTLLFTAVDLQAQDDKKNEIGLTVGLDYVSNYIHRGMYYYSGNQVNGGMFAPFVFYNVLNTGLTLGVKGEITERWVWNGKDEKWEKDYNRFKHNVLDFHINYKYIVKNIITFNIGSWYYHSKKETLDGYAYSFNRSYFDYYFSVLVEVLPLKPIFAIAYSYFMDKDFARGLREDIIWGAGDGKNWDLYIQLGIGHSLLLFDKTYLDLNAVISFFDKNTYDIVMRDTRSADISDIDLSAGVSATTGILTFSASFHYVIVPGIQYKNALVKDSKKDSQNLEKDIHRFYAKFGVSCSI